MLCAKVHNYFFEIYKPFCSILKVDNMNVKLYREWIDKEDFYFTRFDLLATQLEKFILEFRLTDPKFTCEVASQFENVLRCCDEIDYQEDSTATAYGILHFLPRFRRFQLTFGKLVDKLILPFGAKAINSLDIGTGPGPSLFALSDTYNSLRRFGEINNISYLKNLEYQPDYVERSSGFRNWLHHFTEFANFELPQSEEHWNVPYHHGSFREFDNIEFNESFTYSDIDDDGDYVMKTRKVKHRFNVVVCSNFFTQVSQIEALKIELQNCMRFMRNNGKLIISGGSGVINNNKNYPEIYKKAKEILLDNVYGNYKFYAKAKYLKVTRNKLSFNLQDRFGQRIKQFNKKILDRLYEHNAIDCIPVKFKDTFINSASDTYDYEYKWEFHIFEKFARLKTKRKTPHTRYNQ